MSSRKKARMKEPRLSPTDVSRNESNLTETQQDIQEKISRHQQEIVALARLWNAENHIARLTDEILAQIFLQYVLLCWEDSSFDTGFYQWIGISGVCQRWRKVILDIPRLRSYVVLTRTPQSMQEVLERSPQTPLALKADIRKMRKPSFKAFKLMLNAIHRAYTLHLDLPRQACQLLHDKKLVAPRLESIVYSERYLEDSYEPFSNHGKHAGLSQSQFPRLATLEASHCTFKSMVSLIRPTLTYLGMSKVRRGVTLPLLLNALKNLKPLEVLRLSNSLPTVHETQPLPDPNSNDTVDLTRLQSLHISGIGLSCINFLNHISFPPAATLSLHFQDPSSPKKIMSIVTMLFTRLAQIGVGEPGTEFFHGLSFSASTQRKRSGTTLDIAKFDLWTTSQITNFADKGDTPLPNLSIWLSSTDTLHAITKVVTTFPVSAVSFLHCGALSHSLSFDEWKDVSSKLSKVEVLRISGTSSYHLLHALSTSPSESSSSKRAKPRRKRTDVLFPLLQTVILQDVDFKHGSASTSKGVVSLDQLSDMLRWRRSQGLPIQRLVIKGATYLKASTVSDLGQLVDEVVWDRPGHNDELTPTNIGTASDEENEEEEEDGEEEDDGEEDQDDEGEENDDNEENGEDDESDEDSDWDSTDSGSSSDSPDPEDIEVSIYSDVASSYDSDRSTKEADDYYHWKHGVSPKRSGQRKPRGKERAR